jgi:hypothetical protein
MERQKLLKVMTIGMSFVLFAPVLITGLASLLPQSAPTVSSAPAPTSQDAQFAADENGYFAVLATEPNNKTAITGLDKIAAAYVADQKTPKAIAIYQKLIKMAPPQSPQVKSYQQRLAALQPAEKAPPSSQPSSKP